MEDQRHEIPGMSLRDAILAALGLVASVGALAAILAALCVLGIVGG